MGELFGFADCLTVGVVVGAPVASGVALGEDFVGGLFGLAVEEVVGVPVASGLALGEDVKGELFGLADGLSV